ncbi:unnamed protein product [Moneuplotes crassus]|uniref:Uncharacterized protein n=1 Tax=Euplotes crassus TaxID=5936 RepID=A0AAD1X9H7_EUPCR|nr:unnamed protein product [Moneuplotes crassus]
MQSLIENHTKKISGEQGGIDASSKMDKEKKAEIINQMKEEVPVVLLNQWLDIEPEKSGFAKIDNCKLNAEEYSVYSDETMSQGISFKSSAVLKDIAKRKSMMMNNSNQFQENLLKIDPKMQANLTRKLTVNTSNKMNKSKFESSARDIECISEISSDNSESFLAASPMPSVEKSSRNNSVSQSTFRKNANLKHNGQLKIEEREIRVDPPDSPKKIETASLFKMAQCTPIKLKSNSETKRVSKNAHKFYQSAKANDTRVMNASKIGSTHPPPSDILIHKRRRNCPLFGHQNVSKKIFRGKKINEILEVDRYIHMRNAPKGSKIAQPSNTFIPLQRKDSKGFDKPEFNLPTFDKKPQVQKKASLSQTKYHIRISKNIKGMPQRLDDFTLNSRTMKKLQTPMVNKISDIKVDMTSDIFKAWGKSRPKIKIELNNYTTNNRKSRERKFFYYPKNIQKATSQSKNLKCFPIQNRSMLQHGGQLLIKGKGFRNSMVPIRTKK